MKIRDLDDNLDKVVLSKASTEELSGFSRALHALSKRRGFEWDGVFWQRVHDPSEAFGNTVPCNAGSFPPLMILQFTSPMIPGWEGERVAVVESWQDLATILEHVENRLVPYRKKNPFRLVIGQG